jgi:2,5-diketo-D-gluconate reductase A
MPANQPVFALNDSRSMPQFGLGVWQTPADETARVVKLAVELGYRSVDTAAIYRNEEGVGEGLKAAGRDDVFLTTKLWNEDQGYDSGLRAFDASAKRLGTSIDLYLIHWPSPQRGLYVDSWKALVRLQQEGRVGSIGVSNFEPEHLERIIGETGVVPAVNQIELHPGFQQTALRAFHAKHGIHTESWSPLGQAWAKGQDKSLADPVIAAVAAKHGKTAAQAIIRWHIDSGLIVIPKSVNPERIAQNLNVFDFALDAEDMAAFAALDRADGRLGPDPLTATF